MKKIKALSLAVAAVTAFTGVCLTGFTIKRSDGNPTRYCGGGSMVSQTETISYDHKATTSSYAIPSKVPDYCGTADASNCANVAGAEIIGYYDRFYEDLVPNYKGYVQIGSGVMYRGLSTETQNMMVALKTYMGTQEGTTFDGFHQGMRTYVQNCSLSYSVEDLGSLNFVKYKAAVEAGKPVALFLSDYAYHTATTTTSGGEVITVSHSSVAHVVVGYGYKVDTYYDANYNVLTTRTYLNVASGFATYGLCILSLNGKSTVDRASAITIS